MTELEDVLDMGYWISRTMCDVLKEMRNLNDKLTPMVVDQHKRTFAYLIEEVQSMGNRMEAALTEKGELEEIHEEWRQQTKKMKKLKAEIRELAQKKEELEDES